MSSYWKADGGWGETATDLYDTTGNLWVWHDATNYYLSALVGQPLSIDSVGSYTPSGYKYNAKDYRVCGALYLWYDSSLGYVLSSYLGFGTAEYSETVDEVTTWYGDAWWSCDTLTGSYIPRGSGKVTGTAKTVANAAIVGLYKTVASTKIGIYTDVASPAVLPSKYIGQPEYQWQGGAVYPRNTTKYNGQWWYGTETTLASPSHSCIWWNGENWITSIARGEYQYFTTGNKYFYRVKESGTTPDGSYERFSGTEYPAPSLGQFDTLILSGSHTDDTAPLEIYYSPEAIWL